MADKLNPIASEYLDRLKDSLERTSSLGRMSYWLEKNTRLHSKPYSLKGHEYVREIMDSTHPDMGVIKPSQVGASESIARLGLGFLAINHDIVAMYTMPTVHEALRFSKSRMDVIIRDSKYLSSIIINGNDSSSFKQLGTSQLFMTGTFGKAIISVPTDLLINDELDFSNPEVIITAESRLRHSRFYNEELDIHGIRRKFSTPTLPQLGISAFFDSSDKKRRLVRCRHCRTWFWPNFLFHVVVPGYDRDMADISYLEVQDLDERGLLNKAELLCEKCRKPITKANLQPEYREWVAESPHIIAREGFHVSPFDLPDYHSPTSLLREKLQYKEQEGHFRNFTLGLGYADATNSVLATAVEENTCLAPMYPDSAHGYGLAWGLDVGKTSWLTIGKPVGNYLHVLWAEQIRINASDEESLFAVAVERIKQFRIVKGVADGEPYTDTMLRIQGKFAPGQIMLNSYNISKTQMGISDLRESDYVLKTHRTKSLDLLVKKINNGLIKFARFPDLKLMSMHLQNMKRVDRQVSTGEISSDWVNTGPDHYMHSLNYLNLAARMITLEWSTDWSPGLKIEQATVGRLLEKDKPANPLNLFARRD